VKSFLDGGIEFVEIAELVDRALQAHERIAQPSLDEILEIDAMTRLQVQARLPRRPELV
jgi:1-deoxy-D-xylulose-5-phosphate reductoisomerase